MYIDSKRNIIPIVLCVMVAIIFVIMYDALNPFNLLFSFGLIASLFFITKFPYIAVLFYATAFDSFAYIAELLNLPFGIRSLIFCTVMLFILLLFAMNKKIHLAYFSHPAFIVAILFGIIMYIWQHLLTPFSGYGAWKVKSYFLFNITLMFAIILFSDDIKAQRRIVYAAFIFGVISCFVLFYQLGTEGSIVHGRFSGFSNPIWLGRSLGIFLFSAGLTFFLTKHILLKLLVIFIMISLFYFILITGSRGPLYALFLTIIIFFTFIVYKISITKKILVCLIFVITLFLVFPYLDPVTQNRHVVYDLHGSYSARIGFLEESLNMFVDAPFLGSGPGAFAPYSSDHRYPHNIIAEIAVELGGINLVVFTIFLLFACRILRKVANLKIKQISGKNIFIIWASLVFIFACINAMFSGDIATNSMIWFASGCLIAGENTLGRETYIT